MTNKQYVKFTLLHIKKINRKTRELYKLDFDIINESVLTNTEYLLKGISIAVTGKINDELIDTVEWWLYEPVDKIIYYQDTKITVKRMDNFIDYLFSFYEKQ